MPAYSAYLIARDTNPDQTKSMRPTFQRLLEDLGIALIRGGKTTTRLPDPTRRTEHNIDRIFQKLHSLNTKGRFLYIFCLLKFYFNAILQTYIVRVTSRNVQKKFLKIQFSNQQFFF